MNDTQFPFAIDNIIFSYINKSNTHGNGLFAETHIKAGTILGTLDGQVLSWKDYNLLEEKISDNQHFIFMEWNALDKNTLLVRAFRTKYSFINHSRQPNLQIKYNPMRIVAIRDILADEEFFLDYRKEPLSDEYLAGHGKTYL